MLIADVIYWMPGFYNSTWVSLAALRCDSFPQLNRPTICSVQHQPNLMSRLVQNLQKRQRDLKIGIHLARQQA